MAKRRFKDSSLRYVLEALVPYSEANMLLTFKPNKFFDELERIDQRNRHSYQNAFSRSKRLGLVELGDDNIPRLTEKGWSKVRPYVAKKLEGDALLMIVFDIPDDYNNKRRQLRILLRELKFKQVQKSVWSSRYDHRSYLKSAIKELGLQDYIRIFEAAEI